MSFFRKFRHTRETDEELKERLMKKDRKGNEKRRDKFLSEYDKKNASKELQDSSLVDNDPSTQAHEGPTLNETPRNAEQSKKSLRERIEDYKIKRKGDKFEKDLKARKRVQDRTDREEEELKSREKKIFGKELTAEERAEIQKEKEERKEANEQKKIERTQKVKKAYGSFQNTLGKVEKERAKLAGFGTNIGFGTGLGGLGSNGLGTNKSQPLMGNPDMLNALSPNNQNNYQRQKLGNDMISFDLNFGNMLGGKKANKKPGKHPLSI